MSPPTTSAPRPRIIERWFPCAEVSAASGSGWGSSNSETLLMSWFAKRPLAQARAAVLCSLLPWPEDPAEQERVQAVLREALGVCQDPTWYQCAVDACDKPDCNRKTHLQQANRPHAHGIIDCAKQDPSGGYDAARTDVLSLLQAAYPDRPAQMLDPFAGRGLIPLEAARYGQQAHAIDYSPVATLASRLLIDWPFRDWSGEPELPFDPPDDQLSTFDPNDPQRLVRDIAIVQAEVQRRIEKELDEFYPDNEHGEKPWGYLWAQVIPCDGCGREFPLYGSNLLHGPHPPRYPDGVSFELKYSENGWTTGIVDYVTDQPSTMRTRSGKRGKLAWCPRAECGHAHELPEHKVLVRSNYADLTLLVVADLDGTGKVFRAPSKQDVEAPIRARHALEDRQVNGLSARPDERLLPASGVLIRAMVYGAQDLGDLAVDRQNLLNAAIAMSIADIADDLLQSGGSLDYARALAGYCCASLVRKLKRSTRGANLMAYSDGRSTGVNNIFSNESSLSFNYDSFEVGLAPHGPGTWNSACHLPSIFSLYLMTKGMPATVERGSALSLMLKSQSLDAVVTDPPYDFMIAYSDVSDMFYAWARRALGRIEPDFAMTSHPNGLQEKAEEIIVKQGFEGDPNEHRTPAFYDENIAAAFAECRRVVDNEGVVSIVFGHGDADVWKRLLDAISRAGLMLTGAWPANTEKGGSAGLANIQTTLTLACRPAPVDRPDGRVAEVDAEMRRVIAERVREVWNPSGLSYVDQKMAAAGPALEVVGRYERILDKTGEPVDLTRYLPLARQAVTEAHDLHFDTLPLDTFDQKTRFALEWVRSFGRKVQAASEARWNRLAADMDEADADGVLRGVDKGVRLVTSKEAKVDPVEGLPLFEVALAAAAAWREGTLADAAAAIRSCGVEADDPHFWACLNALSKNLPETDADGSVWTSMVRNRDALAAGVVNAEAAAAASVDRETQAVRHAEASPQLFEDPNSLFGQEGGV